jgi:hypothetical protein
MVENEEGRADALRASDDERNEALRALATHFSEGRLDRAEFDERADAALEARTLGDLRALFTDLPTRPSAGALSVPSDALPGTGRPGMPVQPVALPLFPLVPMLIALSVVVVLHGLPPFPLVALLVLVVAHRRGRRWDGPGRPDARP